MNTKKKKEGRDQVMKKVNSVVSIILIFLIMGSSIMPNFALKSHPEDVHILNAEDLIQFSQDCSFDNWSKGRNVFLDADIDLDGIDFLPIPIFLGTFHGQGHTISGLSITVEGSNQGLFRYLKEGAVIKDLSVQGVVTPMGEKSTIGGIVGHNNGILENCKFSGFVKGKDTVGGLVGWSCSTSKIINSSFDGVVYGESKVGGIVGHNAGIVLRCYNDSKVNTTVEEQKLGLSDITFDNINFSSLIPDATDIGGIAGLNIGIIQNSENHGKVGYPHVGYNVGGIVGRQSGYITKCTNYGTVYGRKEVGGIVGQIEPHISTVIGSSKLKQLQKELNVLDSTITNVINDTKSISDITTNNLLFIQDNIDDSKNHAQSLIDQTQSMINIDIEEINKISIIGVGVLDRLIPITENIENTIGVMGKAIDSMEKSMIYISRLMKESVYLTNKFKGTLDSLEKSIGKTNNAKDKLKKAHIDILKATELLQNGEVDGVEELLQSAFSNIKDVSVSLKKAIENIDLKLVFNEAENMISSIEDSTMDMTYALDYMLQAIEIMELASADIDDIFEGVTDLLKYLSEEVDLKFKTTDDVYQKTKEDLYGSITEVSTSLSQFVKDINKKGNQLMGDIQAVNDQLFKVMNLMINMIEEISSGDVDKEDIVKDVSSDDIEKKTEGKVSDCTNFGTIEGDLNVGGIAGGMSIELFDPEVDLNLKGKLSYNTVFESRATIYRCENKGNIIAKKNAVGGIVGSMDLGYIKDCTVWSSIESIDGNYVGGIAGKSDAPIVSSYARGTLEGGNYIGGISGLAKEIVNSYTMVKVNRFRANVGAIAGNIEKDNNIKNNFFVSDLLRGIDGISYKDKAEPIAYANLITIENIPDIFKGFKLNFWVDDKIVDTIDFNYGDTILEKNFPEFPSKDGYYGRWEEFHTEKLSFDGDIHAEYTPYMSILDSSEKRNDILPIVLVEGAFFEGDAIILSPSEIQGPTLKKYETQVEQWKIEIPEDGETSHVIRYIPMENKKNLEVYILVNDKWSQVEFKRDGKYLVFEAVGNNIIFSIVDPGVTYIKYGLLIGIGILLMIIFIVFSRRNKKRKAEAVVEV